jgi:hypothetical protein
MGPAALDVDLAGVSWTQRKWRLLAVRSAAFHARCHVLVCHPRPIVRRVLDVTGLLNVFTVEPQRLPAGPEHPAGPLPPTVTARRRLVPT